jgi:ferredoxin
VRNAHVAAARETTDAAQQVRVYNPAEGLDITFPVEPGEYVLDAAERAGFVLPYSCRAGGCLSCSAQAQGPVEFDMGEQYVLEPEVVAAGFCLLCCTSVRSAATFLSHQQDNIPA